MDFYLGNQSFRSRIIEIHSGPNATVDGFIGHLAPEDTIDDIRTIRKGNLNYGLQEINGISNHPTYSYTIDYLDAFGFSDRYAANIPTAQETRLCDLEEHA